MPWFLLSLLLLAPRAWAAEWPSLSDPPRATGGGERDAALLIGVEDYAFIPDVPGATANVDDWYLWLTRTRQVPAASVALLRDSEATLEKMRRFAGEAAANVGEGGTLWVVFVGHGAPTRDGQDGMLVGADAQQDADSLFARSLPQEELISLLSSGSQERTIAVVDACFSGRTPSGAELVEGIQFVIPSSLVSTSEATVLTAGRADQFAGPLPGASRPAFSYLVLGALHGWGDLDGDGGVTPQEATTYSTDALRMLVRDRTQTPEIAGPAVDAVVSTASAEGPDLSKMVLESRPAGTSDVGFAAESLSLEIPAVTIDTSASGLGDVDMELERRLDDALVAQDDAAATDATRRDAWCRLADYPGDNPYATTAEQACERWTVYVADQERLGDLVREDYAKLESYLALQRKPIDQKLTATRAFLAAYGELDDARIQEVHKAQKKLEKGKPATLGSTTSTSRSRSGGPDVYYQVGAHVGAFLHVAGQDVPHAADVAATGCLMFSVKNHGPFLGLELEGLFSPGEVGTRLFGSFKVATGGERRQISASIGPGYSSGIGSAPLALHEVVELWFQTDDHGSWFAYGPRLELQHYGVLGGFETTAVFLGFGGMLGGGDAY